MKATAVISQHWAPRCQHASDIKLMLALYREALGVKSSLFSFFGLFKILNTKLTGDEQKDWVDRNIHRLAYGDAVSRINGLNAQGKAVGTHVYNDLRMAVIHASENRNVNPDDPKAISLLSLDLPLMRALAELCIEDCLASSTMHDCAIVNATNKSKLLTHCAELLSKKRHFIVLKSPFVQ